MSEDTKNIHFHKVRFSLSNKPGPHNQVFIDDQEIHHVTEIRVVARAGGVGEVTITFFATAEGEIDGATEDAQTGA